jgi:hypothetical protein
MKNPQPKLADDIIRGAPAIARELGFKEHQVYRMLEMGQLPAKRIGLLWITTRSALREHFTPTPASSPEMKRASAGGR